MQGPGSVLSLAVSAAAALTLVAGWILVPMLLLAVGKIERPPKGSYERAWKGTCYRDALCFLEYVQAVDLRAIGWRTPYAETGGGDRRGWVAYHIAAMAGSVALLMLPALFWSHLNPGDALAMPALVAAVVGATLGLLAVMFDLFGTPILADIVVGDPDEQKKHSAWLIWLYVERWRERGFKSLSLTLVGLWMMWLHFPLRAHPAQWPVSLALVWASLIGGAISVLLGVTQFTETRLLGQRGKLGMPLMLVTLLIWGSLAFVWFLRGLWP